MNASEIKKWNRDGYIVLKKVINPSKCNYFKHKIIKPILKSRDINLNQKKFDIPGELLLSLDGSDHPLGENNKFNKWSEIFQSKKLLSVLDQIHGSSKKWKWLYGAEKGLGWIHLRYPFSTKKEWSKPTQGWHLDGIIDNKINPHQSVIILPLITKINPGGGGTAILPGSHKLINEWILKSNNKIDLFSFIYKQVKRNFRDIFEINGNAGDILILHPHLIHSSSENLINQPIRITFNLSTQYL